jgi:arylsulfatase A-like enzyme
MNRISIFFLFLLLGMLYVTSAQSQSIHEKSQRKKPNILFILTDDLGYGDIGVFYQNERKKANDRSEPWTFTPNIDHLAKTGAQLTQHYCAAPVCAPSRASILLGVSQGHANVRDNQFDKALEDNYTIASSLKKLGYKTAAFGKWGLQGEGNGPHWEAHPLKRGFDYYFGYIRHNDGHEHYPKEGVYRNPKQVWENYTEVSKNLDKCYTADLWTAAAKKWIIDFEKDNKKQDPFFIYLAYETPHAVLELPTQAYPAGGGLHGGLQWLGQPGHMINTASGKVDSWIHPDYANATYDDDKNPSTSEVAWPGVYKRYATSVRRIDSEVGDLIQLLKNLRIDENTIVVFTSDNGPSLESYLPKTYTPNHPDFFNSFGPFDGIKRDCWEGGVRVPTIAAWPGHIPANRVIKTPSCSYDWLPTFTEAAGVAAPVRIDGVSLLPSLTDKGKQRKNPIYIEYYESGTTPGYTDFDSSHRNRRRNQMQFIRIGDTVGVRYNIQSQQDDFEIYNIIKDPKEINNLASSSTTNTLQNRLREQVLQMRRPDTSAPRPYDNELIAACTNKKTKPGIIWKAYNGTFPWIADLSKLNAHAFGITASLGKKPIKGMVNGILYFEGYILIPQDGDYTFYLRAASPAYLRLHDASVIDADYGYIRETERSGSIRLKAGLHPLRLYYKVEKNMDFLLDLKWQGPGMIKQTIPSDSYFHF